MALGPNKTQTALSEINVTPLVDVMLVLLIIFMISAPLMQQGVSIDLPKTQPVTLTETPEQVRLFLMKDQTLQLDDQKLTPQELLPRLNRLVKKSPKVQILIQADQNLSYGFVAKVMATVKAAQITKVGLVTLPEEGKP
jgi:biopolymer transport protein TolR